MIYSDGSPSFRSDRFRDDVAAMIRQGEFFSPSRPAWIARAPGRLDVMGGNVDYTGGMVLQLPLREAVRAAVQRVPEPRIRVFNPGVARFGWETVLEISTHDLSSLAAIEEAAGRIPGAHWARFVFGAFHLLEERYGALLQGGRGGDQGSHGNGAHLFLASELPPNRGVASSAAIAVATLKAASAACGIELAGVALAEAAQWVENVVAHSACGIMDQAAIVLGRRDCLLPLVCRPCTPLPPIPLPQGVRLWGIDSMVSRSTGSTAYATARAAAFMGYKMICLWEGLTVGTRHNAEIPGVTDARWGGYLSQIAPSLFRTRYQSRLPESMTGREFFHHFGEHLDPFTTVASEDCYPVRAAVRYATEENLRIATVKELLQKIDPARPASTLQLIGELMKQSHQAYGECGLGADACDHLVALAEHYGFFGAKMTGGGAGGVVAVLGLAEQESAFAEMAAEYAVTCGAVPNVFRDSSEGVDAVGVEHVSADRDPGRSQVPVVRPPVDSGGFSSLQPRSSLLEEIE